MKRPHSLASLAALAALLLAPAAQAQRVDVRAPRPDLQAQRAAYDALVARHAQANGVPEMLVHRVIGRESRYQPALIGRGGTIGLMQIKLATARGLGYSGDAEGLRDPDTNLAYGVKYLAGAYHAAGGDHARTIHYFAAGYYDAAKRQRLEQVRTAGVESSGNPVPAPAPATPKHARASASDARAQWVPAPLTGAKHRQPR